MILLNDLRRQQQVLGEELKAAIGAVCDRGWFSMGEEVRGFEMEFAEFCGVAHCVGLNSGTDALEFALRSVGVGPRDAVATVANAGGYASTAIRVVGATPYYIDVDRAGMNMSAGALDAEIGQVAAVIVTHLYGRLAAMDDIVSVACGHGVPVIEDGAHAAGARRDKFRAGAIGDLACFSFYPTKNLGACGDAGAVVTCDAEIAARCRQLAQYGWSERYNAELPGGRNSRMDEMQAAVLRVKLPHLDGWNERRRRAAELYQSGLQGVRTMSFEARGAEDDTVHLFVVECEERNAVLANLRREGVGAGAHYPVPDHHQPAFRNCHRAGPLPVTEALCSRVLSLPCYPEITDDEVATVIDVLRKLLGGG
jgi:dTDP-4-amino-4,6-dideoxygalactose transaminase